MKSVQFESHIDEGINSPKLSLGGLKLWIIDRMNPNYKDTSDLDWLKVIVHYQSAYSSIWILDSLITYCELEHFFKECCQVYQDLKGVAELKCLEGNLNIRIEALSLGQLDLQVYLSPDRIYEHHEYTYELDQTYLAIFIDDLKKVLLQYS